MRLELEQNHSSLAFAENAIAESSSENRAAEAAEHLREGIKAAQSGNRAGARAALLRAADLDPKSESAWLWLSSISEYPEELLVFLTNVLEINPLNARALEWSAATKSLLAKNFIQRGIDAAEAGQQETAVQHFNQSLEYDERNTMAWLWLASLSESNEGKLTYLEKALEFDPENETAKAGYTAARNSIREKLLSEARAAAVAGNAAEADELLDAIIAEEPDAEDAWVLRSHLANGFEAKIAAFKRVLEINPDNATAKSGLESLTSIMDAVAATAPAPEAVVEEIAVEELSATSQEEEAPAVSEEEVNFAEPAEPQLLAVETDWEPEEPAHDFVPAAGFEEKAQGSPFESFAEDLADQFDSQPEKLEVSSFEDAANIVDTDAEAEFETTEQEEFASPETTDEIEEITYELANAESAGMDEIAHVFDQAQQNAEEFHAEPETAETDDEPAIAAPSVNPFDGEEFQNSPVDYATVVSVDLDPEAAAAVNAYDSTNGAAAEPESTNTSFFNVPFDTTMYPGGSIPMPDGHFENAAPFTSTGFETRFFGADDTATVSAAAACPFCAVENDVQAIACQGCLSVLTLADLEMILANSHADKALLRPAVERMESEKATREFTEAELTTLGIGHLNLRNFQYGYSYLQEASHKNPNNVVLSGQVNALLIRLEEIKQQDQAHESMPKGKTILVVDDSPTVRKLIAGKLEKCGHEVFCSSDGVEAMEALESLKPDLILLDITMPRMDGYQVCKLIRSNSVTKDVPVVMISGKDGFFDKVRGRMAGTSGYITKPFGPETLMKAVESYLKPETAAVS